MQGLRGEGHRAAFQITRSSRRFIMMPIDLTCDETSLPRGRLDGYAFPSPSPPATSWAGKGWTQFLFEIPQRSGRPKARAFFARGARPVYGARALAGAGAEGGRPKTDGRGGAKYPIKLGDLWPSIDSRQGRGRSPMKPPESHFSAFTSLTGTVQSPRPSQLPSLPRRNIRVGHVACPCSSAAPYAHERCARLGQAGPRRPALPSLPRGRPCPFPTAFTVTAKYARLLRAVSPVTPPRSVAPDVCASLLSSDLRRVRRHHRGR